MINLEYKHDARGSTGNGSLGVRFVRTGARKKEVTDFNPVIFDFATEELFRY
jgi:hypothetical protein